MAEILQYVHKDTFLHRLHPFTKIAAIIIVCVMCIIATNLAFLTCMVLALLVFAAYSRLLTESLQQLKLILVMSVLFILITIITMPNGDILGYIIPQGIPLIGGLIPVTSGGLEIGLVLTLRFIPTLQIEGQRIHEAQLARGFNPGTGFIGKIRSVAPIAIPLVSNALLRSTVLGLTIDMRGYRTGKKTHVRERILATRDYTVLSVLTVAGCGFIALVMVQMV
jgi:energy-coupling factor transport system permease protein